MLILLYKICIRDITIPPPPFFNRREQLGGAAAQLRHGPEAHPGRDPPEGDVHPGQRERRPALALHPQHAERAQAHQAHAHQHAGRRHAPAAHVHTHHRAHRSGGQYSPPTTTACCDI